MNSLYKINPFLPKLTDLQMAACSNYLTERSVNSALVPNISIISSTEAVQRLGIKSTASVVDKADVAIFIENTENDSPTGEAHAVFINSVTGIRTTRLNKFNQPNICPWLSVDFDYTNTEPSMIVESAIKAYCVSQNTGIQSAAFGGMSCLTSTGVLSNPVHSHLSKLELHGHKEVLLCLDAPRTKNHDSERNTEEAIQKFVRSSAQMHPNIRVRVVLLPQSESYDKSVGPDDFITTQGVAAFKELCNQAAPYHKVIRDFDPNNAAVKRIRDSAPEHFPFIVDKLLPVDVGVMSATGGQGKTTLLIYLNICYVLGRDILGHSVNMERKRNVLIISAEDDEQVFGKRLNDICASMNLSAEDNAIVNASIYFEDFSSDSVRLAEAGLNGNLQPTDVVERIVSAYAERQISWVIADPLVRFGPGERFVNDGLDEIIKVARKIKEAFKCFVLLVHHVSKDSAQKGTVTQHAGRGGTALSDGCRLETQLVLHKTRDQAMPATITNEMFEEGGTVFALHFHKLSHWKCPQEPFWIARKDYSFTWHVNTTPEDAAVAAEAYRHVLVDKIVYAITNYVRSLPEADLVTKSSLRDRREFIAEAMGIKSITKEKIQQCIAVAIDRGELFEEPLPTEQVRGSRKDRLRAKELPEYKY
jgi:RecA-family ATPase